MIDYIYYKTYRYFYKAQKQNDGAVIAMIIFSCFLGLNILTVFTFLEGFQIIRLIELTKTKVIILAILLYLLCAIIFLRKRRYLIIEQRFKDESNSKKIRGTIMVGFYFVLSFVLFVISSIVRYNLIHIEK